MVMRTENGHGQCFIYSMQVTCSEFAEIMFSNDEDLFQPIMSSDIESVLQCDVQRMQIPAVYSLLHLNTILNNENAKVNFCHANMQRQPSINLR